MKFTRRNAATIFASSILVGVFTDTLTRQDIFGLNFLVWSYLWVTILLVAGYLKKRLRPRFLLLGSIATLNATLVYGRAEPVVQAWSVMITLVTLLLMVGMLYTENFLQLTIVNRITEYLTGVVTVIANHARTVFVALSGRSETHRKVRISNGVIIAIFLALVFIGLFSGSDAVFRQQFSFVGNFFSGLGNWLERYNIGRFITILFWTVVSGAALLAMAGRKDKAEPRQPILKKFLSRNDPAIILGTLCAVFGIFILIQIKYLFAGSVLPSDLTYAEYARRGYGELLLATMLASAVIYAAMAFVKDLVHNKTRIILANLLVVLNGIVVLSAWRRLSLYETAYGWTMARFVARLGLLCILFGSVLLLFWVNQRISAKLLFGYSWYVVASVLMVAALMNPIGIITARNITERSGRSVPLDASFINGLSADSYPALCQYAPGLKTKYPGEYQQLRIDDSSQRALRATRKTAKNHGLSAHYTTGKHYKQTYYNCLK